MSSINVGAFWAGAVPNRLRTPLSTLRRLSPNDFVTRHYHMRVGVGVAPGGSLLFSDDGSVSIWRVTFAGK